MGSLRIISLFSIFTTLVLSVPYFIQIKEITCKSQYGECSSRTQEIANLGLGKTLKRGKKDISEGLSNSPVVDSFSMEYKPLDELFLNVIENRGEIAITTGNGEFVVLTGSGDVVDIEANTNLPTVYIEKIDGLEEEALKFVVELGVALSKYYKINKIQVVGRSLIAEAPGGFEIIFPLGGDIDLLLGKMELLLFQLNQELQGSTIDLRFKHPVIK